MKVAISLLSCNDGFLIKRALESLRASDIMEHSVKLFHFDNGSQDGTVEYIKSLSIDRDIWESKENLGITLPRIQLMEAIQREGYDCTVEIHADMLFPKHWFAPLAARLRTRLGIVMPFIIQGIPLNIPLTLVEKIVQAHASDEVVGNVLQVHPWVLNNNAIRDVGYYDPQFSPHECEDDDLMYRLITNDYQVEAVKRSIVVHFGQITRTKLLAPTYNMLRFLAKNGVTILDYINGRSMHPVVRP